MSDLYLFGKLPLPARRKEKRTHVYMPWSSCLPFVDNKYAKLIHRPREVTTLTHFKYPYIAVKAYCGNSFNGKDKFTFHDTLNENGKLLCARCEKIALENGLISADLIVGRHVHLGRLKAIKACCHESVSV